MPFSIKNPEADRLARELAATTGESLTEAVRERGCTRARDELRAIWERCSRWPVLDARSPDDIHPVMVIDTSGVVATMLSLRPNDGCCL